MLSGIYTEEVTSYKMTSRPWWSSHITEDIGTVDRFLVMYPP